MMYTLTSVITHLYIWCISKYLISYKNRYTSNGCKIKIISDNCLHELLVENFDMDIVKSLKSTIVIIICKSCCESHKTNLTSCW